MVAKEWLKVHSKATLRSHWLNEMNYTKHVAPFFDYLRPTQVDAARIRAFIETKLATGANPATIRIYVALISALFVDLCERGIAQTNPARGLPRSVMRLMRSTHDPRTTPFIEKLTDVRRIYLALPEPLNVAYAIGALAGLRTGEVFALRWQHVDLATRRIHLRESVKGPLKDKDSRMVPILDALAPILASWKLRAGTEDRVIPPLRCDGEKIDKGTPGPYLRAALKQLGLERPGLGWYEATRHTFASQWVMAGGSIEKLKEILGHYSVVMTERYAHLRPDLFPASDLGTIRVDLSAGGAEVVQPRLKTGSSRRKAPCKGAELRENGQSRPVSRVLSRRFVTSSAEADIPPGPALPPASSRLPGSAAGRRIAPLCALAPGGACHAARVTTGAVRSYRTVSPLPETSPAVCFLWRCPASRLGWSLTSTLPYGARTFLPRVLSAPASARTALTAADSSASPRAASVKLRLLRPAALRRRR